MKKIMQLKEFSYILKNNKNEIVDYWLERQDVKIVKKFRIFKEFSFISCKNFVFIGHSEIVNSH